METSVQSDSEPRGNFFLAWNWSIISAFLPTDGVYSGICAINLKTRFRIFNYSDLATLPTLDCTINHFFEYFKVVLLCPNINNYTVLISAQIEGSSGLLKPGIWEQLILKEETFCESFRISNRFIGWATPCIPQIASHINDLLDKNKQLDGDHITTLSAAHPSGEREEI